MRRKHLAGRLAKLPRWIDADHVNIPLQASLKLLTTNGFPWRRHSFLLLPSLPSLYGGSKPSSEAGQNRADASSLLQSHFLGTKFAEDEGKPEDRAPMPALCFRKLFIGQ
jgi:hypothetical protein